MQAFAFAVCCAIVAQGVNKGGVEYQGKTKSKRAAKKDNRKALQTGVIKKEYDRFKGKTYYEFDCEFDGNNLFSINFSEKDTGEISTPDMFLGWTGFLNGAVPAARWTKETKVEFLIDGDRFTLPISKLDEPDRTVEGQVTECLWVYLTVDRFNQIANAKSIEFRAGLIEVSLDDKQRKKLAEYGQLYRDKTKGKKR